MPKLKKLPIKQIVASPDTQCRETIDAAVVSEYADLIRAGGTFPPITVFSDGERYWLADGFHRHAAVAAAGLKKIDCTIYDGTKRDAILAAAGANSSHGLRRTNADKRRSALLLLNDPEWSKWSNREIAARCGVSDQFINNLRPTVSEKVPTVGTISAQKVPTVGTFSTDDSRLYRTKHGKIAEMPLPKTAQNFEGQGIPQNAEFEEDEDPPCEGVILVNGEWRDVYSYTYDLIADRCLEEGLPSKFLDDMLDLEPEFLETIRGDYEKCILGDWEWHFFFNTDFRFYDNAGHYLQSPDSQIAKYVKVIKGFFQVYSPDLADEAKMHTCTTSVISSLHAEIIGGRAGTVLKAISGKTRQEWFEDAAARSTSATEPNKRLDSPDLKRELDHFFWTKIDHLLDQLSVAWSSVFPCSELDAPLSATDFLNAVETCRKLAHQVRQTEKGRVNVGQA